MAALTSIPTQHELKRLMDERISDHPRIMGNEKEFDRIRQHRDAFCENLFNKLKTHADSIIKEIPYKYETAPALITFTRKSLDIITVFAGMYMLTGDKEYAEAAMTQAREGYSVMDSLDYGWHQHSLHVSDICVAYSICNDWLNDYISEEDKIKTRRLVKKQLSIAENFFKYPVSHFAKQINNWNAVCVGGVIIACIGLYDGADDFYVKLLHKALKSITLSSVGVAPDGASEEGTGYWEYHLNFFLRSLATLNSYLNTDFGISELPGVRESGDFPLYMHSSDFLAFNFGDAAATPPQTTFLYWLAKHFNKPHYTVYADAVNPNGTNFNSWEDKSLDLFIMLYRTDANSESYKNLPLSKFFGGRQNCMTVRSSWEKGAAFLGFKGGNTMVPHCNLDLGTFVYDWSGVRWLCDLAKEDYSLNGYWDFTAGRWQYYTQRAEGHNTISIDTKNKTDQVVPSFAPIIQTKDGMKVDLSNVYSGMERVVRTFRFDNGCVKITDEFIPRCPEEVLISFHTQTDIERINDDSLVISSMGKRVKIEFEFCENSHIIDVVTDFEKKFDCEQDSSKKYRIMPAQSIYIPELKGSKDLSAYKKIAIALRVSEPCKMVTKIIPLSD
jgi:hypothetical protein